MKLFVVGGGSGLGLELVKVGLRQGYEVGYSTSSVQDIFPGEKGILLRVLGSDFLSMQKHGELSEKIVSFAPDRLIICPVRTKYHRLENTSRAEIFEDISFNVSSVIALAAAYAKARPTGELTFLLSHICFLYNPGFTLYKVGKDAIDSFSKALQFEYPRLNILRVYPGAMKTNFIANTNYTGLALFSPKDPAVWAARILGKNHGYLMGPIDFLFLLTTRFLPFGIQKRLFLLLF